MRIAVVQFVPDLHRLPPRFATAAMLVLSCCCTAGAEWGRLDTIRDDVRAVRVDPPSAPPDDSARDDSTRRRRRSYDEHDYDDPFDSVKSEFYSALVFAGGYLVVATATAPAWVPHTMLGDDLAVEGYFPRFPYDHAPGYMMIEDWPTTPRRWSARLSTDYAENFDDMSRIRGHLLLSTTSRFGLDMEMSCLEERLPGNRHDHLWVGDANIVYRFAQSEHMQWRAGLGFNWLDDPIDTDFGFNFTYGLDVFPVKPWVVSATLDWGTLGSAELFRFRTTAGVVVHGIEVFTGYEYFDVDRTQINSLIGGVRIWF